MLNYLRQPRLRSVWIGLVALATSLALTLAASAHDVGLRTEISVRSPNGRITTYSDTTLPRNAAITSIRVIVYYSTGEPMANGKIQIFAPGNLRTPWRTGTLTPQGDYRFSPDLSRRGRWTIQVQDDGHKNFIDVAI